MFDTHCHLNFSRFKDRVDEVIRQAQKERVNLILIPGTDITTSKKAVEIASQYREVYAAVGIHPHNVYDYMINRSASSIQRSAQNPELITQNDIRYIEDLLQNPKVVAVGEIGMDKHPYKATKYENYTVHDDFLTLQKELFCQQLMLATKHQKSVIFHNREAKEDMLPLLHEMWDDTLRGRTVFHCCEPDPEILSFAKERGMFIGVDGDITYTPDKQEFIKMVPSEMLVLETDAPFLLPEPLRSEKKFPNEPKNLKLICEYTAGLLSVSPDKLASITTENSKRLFRLF